jgi:hypothetical protein
MSGPASENILPAVNSRGKEKINSYEKPHIIILKDGILAWVQSSPEVADRRGKLMQTG